MRSGSIIFRAGALHYDAAAPIMRAIERMAPAATRFVLSHRPYPRSIGWVSTTDAEWWCGHDYRCLVDTFLELIPPTDTIEDRMRAIIATQNTLERHLNHTRGFTHEFVLATKYETISVAAPLTEIIFIRPLADEKN
jgi:hypothetical protein